MTVPTKKEVVTQMAETLVGKCHVSDAPQYVGEWEPLYEDLRRQFEGAYRVFELEFDHEIATSVDDLRNARKSLGSAETNFSSACEQLRKTLEAKIEKAAMDRRLEAVERENNAKRLKMAQPDLRQKSKRAKVALTGGEEVSVAEWPGRIDQRRHCSRRGSD